MFVEVPGLGEQGGDVAQGEKGTPNKATLEIKEAARQYAPAALERLAHLSRHAESEAAQVAACREILDRAYGKPTQPVSGDEDAPLHVVGELV